MNVTKEVITRPVGYITLYEFAERSGYAYRTLLRWLDNGKLMGTYDQFAQRWLISEAEFERVQTQGVADGRRKKQAQTVEA